MVQVSPIDWRLNRGSDIPIEERDESEVLGAWGRTRSGRREFVRVANPSSRAFNPGFDVTPSELITGWTRILPLLLDRGEGWGEESNSWFLNR